MEYLRKNYRKSLRLLASCKAKEKTIEVENLAYYNNIGCIYFKLQRFHASNFYFQKALDININTEKSSQVLLHSYNADISYNKGVSLLFADKPKEAFLFFNACSAQLEKRPHLWIRMAECCVRNNVIKRNRQSKHSVFESIGQSSSRRIVLRRLFMFSAMIFVIAL